MRDPVFLLSQVFFVGKRFKDGELLKDNSSSAGLSKSLEGNEPLPFIVGDRLRIPASILHVFFQESDFFQFGPTTGHSPAISSRPDPATLSSVMLVLLVFSPCSDTN